MLRAWRAGIPAEKCALGLAVVFVLELDNLVGPAFVSGRRIPYIRAYAIDVLQRFESPAAKSPSSAAMRELATNSKELPVLMPNYLSKASILCVRCGKRQHAGSDLPPPENTPC